MIEIDVWVDEFVEFKSSFITQHVRVPFLVFEFD